MKHPQCSFCRAPHYTHTHKHPPIRSIPNKTHCLDKHIIFNQCIDASFLLSDRSSQWGPDEGKYVAYWNRFIQSDSISSHQPHAKCAKLCARVFWKPLWMYWTEGRKKKKNTAPNESWIIPGAKGSIAARLSPRSSIWFISLPSAFQLEEESLEEKLLLSGNMYQLQAVCFQIQNTALGD